MAGVRCLQRKLDKLARSIHPVTVSTALLAKEVIEQRVWEDARREGLPHYDRSLNLLEAVMRSIGARPSAYEQFCEVLEQETVTEGLAAELRESLVSQREKDEELNKHDSQTKEKGLQERYNGEEEGSNTSRKRRRDEGAVCGGTKEGRVSGDKFLMNVAWEVGEKWEELGVVLGLEYKVLHSVVGSQVGKPDHLKAFYMLCEWRSRSGGRATYAALADALEGSGLNSCAEQHCYNKES